MLCLWWHWQGSKLRLHSLPGKWLAADPEALVVTLSTFIRFILGIALLNGIFYQAVHAANSSTTPSFQQWLAEFYPTAAQAGISRQLYTSAFQGINQPDGTVLQKAAYQPEFTQAFWEYLDGRVNARSIGTGQAMARQYQPLLTQLQKEFGIDANVLLAIWSMESNYGEVLKRRERLHYVPLALATLAYADQKRRKFARTQLVAALQILQSGNISQAQMLGSWAGAMGHTQFIPTSYLAYAVDIDGNGRKDIWNSIPDALGTAANLLRKNGWQNGQRWGERVHIPANLVHLQGETKSMSQWAKLGCTAVDGSSLASRHGNAVLKMMSGPSGPAYLLSKNFFVIKRYNNADSYAMAVLLLADQIGGKTPPFSWPKPPGSLGFSEKIRLQTLLKERGYYQGEADGYLGEASRAAIRAFQHKSAMSVDGVPTQQLLRRLEQEKGR